MTYSINDYINNECKLTFVFQDKVGRIFLRGYVHHPDLDLTSL